MADLWKFPLCPEPPDNNLTWSAVEVQYPWLAPLANCPQNPVYHGEGDVLTHTRMVAEALITDDIWRQLAPMTRSILFASALLHDIGKPAMTEIINGRISSPVHTVRGAAMAQQLLYQDWPEREVPVPFSVRQQIVEFVRHHGLPLWLLDKEDMDRTVIRSGMVVQNALIALLSRADVQGRICDDQAELLERVDLFEEYCRKQQCWDSSYEFASDHSCFEYFRHADRNLFYQAYDDTQCEVILMAGLPGAGKDTWIQSHAPDWPVISLDIMREAMGIRPQDSQGPVVNKARERARDYLRQHQSFIWNATNVTYPMRQGLINLFTDYQARTRIVYIEVPWPEVIIRNSHRDRPVPQDVIRRMANQLHVPLLNEAHQVNWIVDD